MYKITFTQEFFKKYYQYVFKNPNLKKRIDKTIKQLEVDPFYPGLRTHKVDTKIYGERFSSRINGDLRLIWDFQNGELVINVLNIGGHSGSHKVYK